MANITCGVPQGYILGPLLFLFYKNDIVNCSVLSKYILFADGKQKYSLFASYTRISHQSSNHLLISFDRRFYDFNVLRSLILLSSLNHCLVGLSDQCINFSARWLLCYCVNMIYIFLTILLANKISIKFNSWGTPWYTSNVKCWGVLINDKIIWWRFN